MGTNTNIPPDRELFVGRQKECALLDRSLRDAERLISIIGPSGTGKTRLARRVGLQLELDYADHGGVWFCDLSAARKEEDLVASVALALDLTIAARSGEEEFVHALRRLGPVLLILDNFESLEAEAGGLVSRWVSQAPDLQVLITSLAALGVKGESVFELGPLAAEDAIALYEDRARRAWAGERVFFSGEQRALDQLVQRLDCLPLAIELAAARVRALPPRVMLSRIEDRFELLRSGEIGRHSSLQHAIVCSLELLDPEERLVFAELSVFVGGFTLTAAEEVLAAGEGGQRDIVTILEGLRDKALIQLDGSPSPRFALYESMQAFAALELNQMGKSAETKRRHAAYYARIGESWVRESRGPNGARALESLIAERENLTAAYRRHADSDPALSARAAIAACVALDLVTTPASVLALVEGAIDAARLADEPALSIRALRIKAGALARIGRIEDAVETLRGALLIAQEHGHKLEEGFIWAERARMREFLQDMEGAWADLEQALRIDREIGEPELKAMTRMRMGLLLDTVGRHAESKQWAEEALELYQGLGDQRSLGRVMVNLAQCCLHEQDYQGAREHLEAAREAFRLAREPSEEATARLGLGTVEVSVGNFAEAEAQLSAALTEERRFGNRRFEGIALANLGLLAMLQAQPRLAARRLSEAVQVLETAGDGSALRRILPFVGAVKAVLGQIDEAKADFDAASQLKHEISDEVIEILKGFLDLALAREAESERRPAEAQALLAKASARLQSTPHYTSHDQLSARRLLERALARYSERQFDDGREHEWPEKKEEQEALPILELNGAWFEPPGGERISLGPKSVRRRLLQALIGQHLLAPGVGLTLEQLLDVGWPGQNAHPSVASNRVYKSINWLRNAGLEGVLVRDANGYLLTDSLVIARD